MAITAIEYALFTYFKQHGGLPERPRVLELGEANWFGDLPIEKLVEDISNLVSDDNTRNRLQTELSTAANPNTPNPRQIAKIFYETFLGYDSLTAIDLYGSENALHLDLNLPVKIEDQFDLCLDFGTAEYVFNTHQFFKSVHELTKPGGVMAHGTSLSGWFTQGLYSFKPSFYWQLAKANQYQILAYVYAELHPLKLLELNSPEELTHMVNEGQISNQSFLYVILKKGETETSFSAPTQ